MIKIRVVPLEEVLNKMKKLFPSHVEETELYQDKISFNPNYDAYSILSEEGNFFFVIAEDGEDIIGYMSLIIEEHPHHMGTLSATNNLLYIKKEYRGNNLASDMFEAAEIFLKSIGVSLFMFSAKASNPLESLAKRNNFDKCEVIYSKYIGDNK